MQLKSLHLKSSVVELENNNRNNKNNNCPAITVVVIFQLHSKWRQVWSSNAVELVNNNGQNNNHLAVLQQIFQNYDDLLAMYFV